MQQLKGWKALVSALAIFAATLAPAAPVNAGVGFDDLPAGQFSTTAVQWMVAEEITFSTSPGCFQRFANAMRGQIATVNHRFKVEPNGATEPFSDVDPSDFFAEAVARTFPEGITIGVTPPSIWPHWPHWPVTRVEPSVSAGHVDVSPAVGDVDVSPPASEDDVSPPVEDDDVSPPASDNSHLLAAESLSHRLLNELRTSLGLSPLARNETMNAFARAWSATMDSLGGLGHSDGPYSENLAWVSSGSISAEAAALRMHDLWSSSEAHYDSMTRSSFDEVGIGFWQSDDGWHATHVFR